ncbi:molybdate ABC transporter substrate-binding protein [Kordiimonas sp. SCSIO 12603]|uniref:molybdate ABC transporter substrate-binding protein n=1 Tax=Kordiimonas sp. SCSIO 12603 TaxID=2829596 RepID=UPI00210223ED|nr:molybdate ABC transporter substrate-binding protein [Kordiimonas sp. SCSIO 12603]UTW57996.1 molybdate ABC transporter substrate-binding protein [Kordiimonas sp. SCSIO 12603]
MKHLLSIGLAIFCIYAPFNFVRADEKDLTIFAAASTQNALIELASAYPTTEKINLSFGGSAIMARQINAGAQTDIFISANREWVQYLKDSKKLQANPTTLVGNRLVLAGTKNRHLPNLTILDSSKLIELVGDTKLATPNPQTAPAGQYVKRYLQSIDAWSLLKGKMAFSPNVRQTLRLIEYGGLPGFIYSSDAHISANVRVLYEIPKDMNSPIEYVAAPITDNEKTNAFINFLKSPIAAQIWEKYGFITIASN